VLGILACVAWALYRPVSQIVLDIAHELKDIKHHKIRLTASATFTIAIMAVITAAIVSAHDWPPQAKVVPLTAAGMALAATGLNLINELFGKQTLIALGGSADSGSEHGTAGIKTELTAMTIRLRAFYFFGWMAVLFALVYLIGFLPAIFLFVFAYMWLGFGEPLLPSLGYAAGTVAVCWGVFDYLMAVPWPQSILGDFFPELRASLGFI
jgi:putative tricarboxylic transport membrane protein